MNEDFTGFGFIRPVPNLTSKIGSCCNGIFVSSPKNHLSCFIFHVATFAALCFDNTDCSYADYTSCIAYTCDGFGIADSAANCVGSRDTGNTVGGGNTLAQRQCSRRKKLRQPEELI